IPEDLKIVGFDDIPLASLATPTLTTIRQPIYEIGRSSVEVIINQLSGIVVPTQIILPVTLVKRQTT
ncbi:MAG: substrate-binding domain-containing protein, partial [Bacillota bacterium]